MRACHIVGRVLLCGLLILAVVGCDAKLETRFDVSSQTQASVSASLYFNREATKGITQKDGLMGQIVSTVTRRTGVAPTVTRADGTVGFEVALRYDQLTSLSDLLGVASASVGPGPKRDHTALTVALVEPTAVTDAIDKGIADQPDAAALAASLKGSLRIAIGVHFDGGVRSVGFVDRAGQPVGLATDRSSNDVTVAQPLSEFREGTLVVVGDPTESLWRQAQSWLWPWGVAVVVGIGMVWWAFGDRRATRASSLPRR